MGGWPFKSFCALESGDVHELGFSTGRVSQRHRVASKTWYTIIKPLYSPESCSMVHLHIFWWFWAKISLQEQIRAWKHFIIITHPSLCIECEFKLVVDSSGLVGIFTETWTPLIPDLKKNFWRIWALVFPSFLEISGKGLLKPSMYFLPVCPAHSWVVYTVFLGISPLWCSQFKVFLSFLFLASKQISCE